MKRRAFITLLGGAAAWPLVARAQQPEQVRRIGVLMNLAAADPKGQAQTAAFLQALQQLGWSEGPNVRIDTRWLSWLRPGTSCPQSILLVHGYQNGRIINAECHA